MGIALFIGWILIGLLIYFVTDTTALARRIERASLFIPYGMALQIVFAAVVSLWPLWLLYLAHKKSGS